MLHKLSPLLLALPLMLAGCGDSSESVGNKILDEQRKLLSLVSGVTDEASASAAAPEIEATCKRLVELVEKKKTLPMKSADFENHYRQEMGKLDGELNKKYSQIRMSNKGAEKVLIDAFKPLNAVKLY